MFMVLNMIIHTAIKDKTYGDIYRHTMSREIEIRNAGYMVVTIWESEWLDYKSSNKVA